MRVSVIVPVYNVAEYVEECIRSVLCQTYRDLELVIVDDCTKDNSMDIIRNVLDSVHTHKAVFSVSIRRLARA